MSDGLDQPTVEHAAVTANGTGPAEPAATLPPPAALPAERPELAVGAAFAGGLVFALFLKRLAR